MQRILESKKLHIAAVMSCILLASKVNGAPREALQAQAEPNQLATPPLGPPSAPLSVAQRSGLMVVNGVVTRNGQSYRGMGVNFFDAFNRTLAKADDTSYEASFQQLQDAKIPFARVMGCGYWPKEQKLYQSDKKEFFRRFDGVVRSAEKHNVGLILPLFWYTATVPDIVGESVNSWANPNSKTAQYAREYVRDVVTRYLDSPAVWGWEVGNEMGLSAELPNASLHRPAVVPALGTPATRSADDELSIAMVRAIYSFIGSEIRRHDPQRVIASGDGFPRATLWHQINEKGWGTDTTEQRREVLLANSPDPLDLISVHGYGDIAMRMIEAHKWGQEIKKPLWVGEFGVKGFERAQVEPLFETMVKTIVDNEIPLSALWVFDRSFGTKEQFNVTATNERAYQLQRITQVNDAWKKAGLQP